jgi:hypothetical protein
VSAVAVAAVVHETVTLTHHQLHHRYRQVQQDEWIVLEE